jgi:hypothetical protein
MENKHLEQLVFQGFTTKDFEVNGHTITFRTLFDLELEDIQKAIEYEDELLKIPIEVSAVLSRSVLYVDGKRISEDYVRCLPMDEFVRLRKAYTEFSSWILEDDVLLVSEAIRELIHIPQSLYHWKILKIQNFLPWKDKWNSYRKEWVFYNMFQEENDRVEELKNVVDILCSFIRPEAIQGGSIFGNNSSTVINQSAAEKTEMAKQGMVVDEVDVNIAQTYRKRKLDEIDIVEIKEK